MNFLNIAPQPSAKFTFTVIPECGLGFTSQAHSFAVVRAKLKANTLKDGVLESNNRTRLHYSRCTNSDKNRPDCIESGDWYALKEDIESTSSFGYDEVNQRVLSTSSSEPVHDEVVRKLLGPVKVPKEKGLLDDQEQEKLEVLKNFVYEHTFDHGCLVIKAMESEQIEATTELLTQSFAEPWASKPALKFRIREHILERRALVPHAVTLIGLYAEREAEWTFCGTVEISLNYKGACNLQTTPVPPKRTPYLFNMAVNKDFRRRGIGWQLLKASEKLVTQMGSGKMHLHCRMIDVAPFSMYTKAGYKFCITDNKSPLVTLQHQERLMYKKLP